ncbi:hypothetical protein IWQ60_006714 [Tieghemiomyces parasiticus]|uniref:RING-type E3 ubiquitin transferase n=1 Tax=Tieghemiomyces parasiticus TaxID=78921 RepID=A0A9W8ABQ5_9FUNG|nr:hypothetical protein IWQ60_006714 [Tieghemiomyces parasiticus]
MRVLARFATSDIGYIDIHKNEPTANIRKKIVALAEKAHEKPFTIRMFIWGKEIYDHRTAFDYSIRDNEAILCTLRRPTPNPSPAKTMSVSATQSSVTDGKGKSLALVGDGLPPATEPVVTSARNLDLAAARSGNPSPSRPVAAADFTVLGEAGDSSRAGPSHSDAVAPGNLPPCLRCKDKDPVNCRYCGCNVCGGKEDEDKTLVCEECQMYFHMACLPTPLTEVPDEDWFCHHCYNDPNTVIAPGEDPTKLSKKRAKMPSATSTRNWGGGMACAGLTTSCTIVKPNHVGSIPGVYVGQSWQYRLQVSESGVHRPPVGGIAGSSETGAVSIVLAAGYDEDEDHGDHFFYTGSGGRNLAEGNKRVGKQSADQELTRFNLALARTCDAVVNPTEGATAINWRKSKAVRVVRSVKLAKRHPTYAPEAGNRYDGLYRLVRYWPQKAYNSPHKVWRFEFRRDDPEPAPWTPEGQARIAKLGLEMVMGPSQVRSPDKKVKMASSGPTGGAKLNRKDNKLSLPHAVLNLIAQDKLNKRNWEETLAAPVQSLTEFLDHLSHNAFKCGICQDLVQTPVTTPCGHNCCRDCLRKSLVSHGNVCPYCRSDLAGLDPELPMNHTLFQVFRQLIPSYGSDVSATRSKSSIPATSTGGSTRRKAVAPTAQPSAKRVKGSALPTTTPSRNPGTSSGTSTTPPAYVLLDMAPSTASPAPVTSNGNAGARRRNTARKSMPRKRMVRNPQSNSPAETSSPASRARTNPFLPQTSSRGTAKSASSALQKVVPPPAAKQVAGLAVSEDDFDLDQYLNMDEVPAIDF